MLIFNFWNNNNNNNWNNNIILLVLQVRSLKQILSYINISYNNANVQYTPSIFECISEKNLSVIDINFFIGSYLIILHRYEAGAIWKIYKQVAITLCLDNITSNQPYLLNKYQINIGFVYFRWIMVLSVINILAIY